jgi:hypothetical protein
MYKRTVSIVPLLLGLLLLSALMMPTAAAKQQKRFKFHSVVKGSGIMYWGIAGLPTFQWGEPEYSTILEDSEVNLACASDAQEGPVQWPALKMLTLTNIQFDKEEMTIRWTHEGTGYELRLRLLSTGETDGMYGMAMWPRQGDGLIHDTLGEALYIGVNLDYSPDIEMLNPQHATLQFEGTYKVDGVEQEISGLAWIAVSEFLGEGFFGKAVGLYLWIESIGKYATFGWRSNELETTGWEQVPPAQVLNIYMKEKK